MPENLIIIILQIINIIVSLGALIYAAVAEAEASNARDKSIETKIEAEKLIDKCNDLNRIQRELRDSQSEINHHIKRHVESDIRLIDAFQAEVKVNKEVAEHIDRKLRNIK